MVTNCIELSAAAIDFAVAATADCVKALSFSSENLVTMEVSIESIIRIYMRALDVLDFQRIVKQIF